jgi:hypothetical protein
MVDSEWVFFYYTLNGEYHGGKATLGNVKTLALCEGVDIIVTDYDVDSDDEGDMLGHVDVSGQFHDVASL